MMATTDTPQLHLRQAERADIPALEALLNHCYRDDAGWTNEAELIGGIRATPTDIAAVIDDPKHYLFAYPKTDTGTREGQETGDILGCIAVEIHETDAYIGMFAVHPSLQGQGLGNQMLAAAETFSIRHLQGACEPRLTMSILSERPELLAYYERRGYELTGEQIPFPNDGNNGQPKRDDLVLLTLQKKTG